MSFVVVATACRCNNIAVSAMFLAAGTLQWACQRRGWAIVMPFLS